MARIGKQVAILLKKTLEVKNLMFVFLEDTNTTANYPIIVLTIFQIQDHLHNNQSFNLLYPPSN